MLEGTASSTRASLEATGWTPENLLLLLRDALHSEVAAI